jgi:hypothetical protein
VAGGRRQAACSGCLWPPWPRCPGTEAVPGGQRLVGAQSRLPGPAAQLLEAAHSLRRRVQILGQRAVVVRHPEAWHVRALVERRTARHVDGGGLLMLRGVGQRPFHLLPRQRASQQLLGVVEHCDLLGGQLQHAAAVVAHVMLQLVDLEAPFDVFVPIRRLKLQRCQGYRLQLEARGRQHSGGRRAEHRRMCRCGLIAPPLGRSARDGSTRRRCFRDAPHIAIAGSGAPDASSRAVAHVCQTEHVGVGVRSSRWSRASAGAADHHLLVDLDLE